MYNFSVFIQKEDNFFVAQNLELWVVSQWITYEEALSNLREATELYLEDENKASINNSFKNNSYFLTNMTV